MNYTEAASSAVTWETLDKDRVRESFRNGCDCAAQARLPLSQGDPSTKRVTGASVAQ